MHSSLTHIFETTTCQMLNSFGVKSILARKRQRIVFPTNWKLLLRWLVRPNATGHFTSYQKTTIWQEMTLWCFLMSGINGSEKSNVYIAVLAINFLILQKMLT